MYAEDGDGNIYNDNSSTEADGKTKDEKQELPKKSFKTRLPGSVDNGVPKRDSRELFEQQIKQASPPPIFAFCHLLPQVDPRHF